MKAYLIAGCVAVGALWGAMHTAVADEAKDIIGTWSVVSYTPNPNAPALKCVVTGWVFQPTSQSVIMNGQPQPPLQASYMARPNNGVAVFGNTSFPAMFTFIDQNHIINNNDMLRCVYQRQ